MLSALLALWSSCAAAQSLSTDPLDRSVRLTRVSVGPLKVGEDHPLFDLADFPVSVEGPASASWEEGSVRWLRGPDGLPVPAALLVVRAPVRPESAFVRYRGRALLLQGDGSESYAELLVPLLEPAEAEVVVDGKPAAKVRAAVRAALSTPPERRHAIDHSCSAWGLRLEGLDDVLATASCRLGLVGRVGSEEAVVEVRWAAAGVALPDASAAVFSVKLRDLRPARVTVTGPDASPRVVSLSARVSPRWHRLRLSWGAGPYGLTSSAGSGNGGALSLMLYGNFRLRHTDSLSLRAFDAAVGQSPNTAFFNNLGFYFAHDLARPWDERILFTPLLGVQAVTFSPHGWSHASYTEALYPQGFEVTYLDAFGARGKTLSGGVFLQPTANQHYDNLWLRYGGRWFAELNYIAWRSGSRHASMWGVSVGLPLAQLF